MENIYNAMNATESTERSARWFTSKGAFVETLFDAVGPAHVEGLSDLLVHEALSVQDVGHHHPQVKHLKQLGYGGHLHQIPSALVQAACVQVLEHRLESEPDEKSKKVCSLQ